MLPRSHILDTVIVSSVGDIKNDSTFKLLVIRGKVKNIHEQVIVNEANLAGVARQNNATGPT